MTLTIADRIRQSAAQGFVGRTRELDALASALAAGDLPFLVAFVHGPGGIGKSRLVRQVLTTLEIPAALPSIFGGLRVGVTLAVVGAIVAEWAGAERGLGVLINLARGSLFDIPLMFATLLTIAVVGIALYLVVVLVERRLVGAR